jgi:hypothetical protein
VSLDRLVGTWRTEARFPNGVSGTGTTTFELVLRGEYLLQRATVEVDGPPEGLMVIGPGEHGAPTQHYFDSRGVTRRYAMTLEGDTWTLERDGVQRYLGRFEDDDTIRGAWEWFRDGAWQHDFELDYRRSVAP